MNKKVLKESIINNIKTFRNAVDIEYQMDFSREYARIGDNELYGGKHAGSDAEHQGAFYIAEELKKIGVQNVELIPIQTSKFQFNSAELTVIADGSNARTMKPYSYVAPGTDPNGITAELIDAGESKKSFYGNHNISGKIAIVKAMGVLEGACLSMQIMEAEQHGAVAVLAYAWEDILNENTIRVQPLNYIAKIPVVGISLGDANYLLELIEKDSSIQINLKVDSIAIEEGGTTYEVVGEIPGILDERIIYSGHYDHYFRCMQDNISSVATMLGVAKGMVECGYKPNRTITFVFNGSHETGMFDTRYPYISGSYKLIDQVKKDWPGKAIVDINFEYSALELNELRAFGSYEKNKEYLSFLDYVPSEAAGYKTVSKEWEVDDYYLMSWADTISYISNGIPTIMNDSIHEQYHEFTSPYIGRDHSNFDNFEVYCEPALKSNTQHFGSLGIFVDNMPLTGIDFSLRTRSLILSADDKSLLKKKKIAFSEYERLVELYNTVSKCLYEKIEGYNRDESQLNEKSLVFNEAVLKIYKEVVDTFDKISPHDFITVAHRKYIDNILALENAIGLLENGDVDKALHVVLPAIDIAACSLHFDQNIVEHAMQRIADPAWAHKRLWARDRELSCLTLFDIIQKLEKKQFDTITDFSEEIQLIKEVAESESEMLRKCIAEESASLGGIVNELNKLIKTI